MRKELGQSGRKLEEPSDHDTRVTLVGETDLMEGWVETLQFAVQSKAFLY